MKTVNAFVEVYDETASFSEYERCAEFVYSDDAMVYAKAAHTACMGAFTYRVTDLVRNQVTVIQAGF